ncbi:MAG: T9SS type A sorting domain-containing protein [Candidatus Marinimicrobia bacterium]|nr:T9SS type A sorting domain-containing protein [Candidatus Neomarinimicrobiota bacterium]
MEMNHIGEDIYYGEIPGFTPGTEVTYWISATDVNGNSMESQHWSYDIFNPSSNSILFLYNSIDYGSFIAHYYLGSNDINFDYWSNYYYGPLSEELLNYYTTVLEITGSGPVMLNNEFIRPWFEEGNKNYILSGNEWLDTHWGHQNYYQGDFEYDILGVWNGIGDINYVNTGNQEGISRILPIENDSISGPIFEFLGDSLDLNYDPNYELGFSNWLDAVEIVDGFNNGFDAYSGIIDSNGVPWEDAELYHIAPYKKHGNESKSVFFTFDPLAVNTSPEYNWIGFSDLSPIRSALDWINGSHLADTDDEYVVSSFQLHQNYPNPFNPLTTIQYNIPKSGNVRLSIFDLRGNEIKELTNEFQRAGLKEILFDASGLSSGVYFYRIETTENTLTRKMIFLK